MSFKIEEWQVMQAWKNGARISSTSRVHTNWVLTYNPEWDWKDNDYRISDLTADGMLLDELVDKWPEKVTTHPICAVMGFVLIGGEHWTNKLIQLLVEHPSEIKQVKVKQEKKLRPWTMEEFEKHRDEWFYENINKRKILRYNNNSVLPADYDLPIDYITFMERFRREDGSPCGVLE